MVKIKTVLFCMILSLAGNAVISGQVCTPAPIGLISNYSGDGNALDARSRYNGTIQNGVTYTAGKVGQAFDLAGNNGDRVLLGNPPDLQRQNFTIEAWVKRSSASVVTNSPGGGGGAGLFLAYGSNGYAFYIKGNNRLAFGQVAQSEVTAPTFTITDTNWHHVAVTQSGPPFTGGTLTTFYLDGVAETVAYGPQLTFTTNVAIGSRGDAQTTDVFFGVIDELSIYDRPLPAAQIQAIFNAGTAGKCKPFATNAPDNQAIWLAGDGEALDLTGNGNDGSLLNGTGYAVGRVGQGFQFDGVDDQITIPHNANQNGGTNLTLEAWIYPNSLPHGSTIIQKRTSGNIGGYVFEPTQAVGGGSTTNGLSFVVMIGGSYQFLFSPANTLTTNAWQHVAATYDGAFMRIYVNGAEVGNRPQTGAIDASTAPVVVGRNAVNPSSAFNGGIDEIGLYNRALTASEVQSISNAGLAGKYKAQATVPADIAAWYPGDGNTNDLQAANSGTLQGGATYAQGKVGQAFAFNGTSAYVSAPSTPANDPTGAGGATMEAWIYLNQLPSTAGRNFYVMSKNSASTNDDFALFVGTDNGVKFQWANSVSGGSHTPLQTGRWYHVVVAYSQTEQLTRYYLNGVFLNTQFAGPTRTPSGEPLAIGRETPIGSSNIFNGLIDEPAIYNRNLSEAEIRDQYYAGSFGKYKGGVNPAVLNTARTGNATVTFGSVTTSGSVQQLTLDAGLLPALPMGTNTGLNYDISTSVVGSNPTVCLNMSSFTPAQFTNLKVFHVESGVWQDRTATGNVYPNLCTTGLTSLSPFAVGSFTPTSADSSISGRVIVGKGGLSNAVVTISGGNLPSERSVRTNQFGVYRFDDLEVGQIYTLTVYSRKYTFEQNTLVVDLLDEITEANFTATNR